MKKNMKTFLRGTALGASALYLAGGIAYADQVIVDDLIVQFSLCVGNDCVNGENFGFDTIRMKENNTRLHFQDTSNSGSFPSADWRLVANDSSNGGSNKFAIEDVDAGRQTFIIEQGAPANAMFMSNSGDLGIGTSNPIVEVQAVDGNTPTLRLEQNGSNGFTPQTWDLAGNEAGFFIRDVTNGSQLPFRIIPGADSEITGDWRERQRWDWWGHNTRRIAAREPYRWHGADPCARYRRCRPPSVGPYGKRRCGSTLHGQHVKYERAVDVQCGAEYAAGARRKHVTGGV
ncbi:hypothetical protein [Phaeobacter sp. J2-8]|uniref:hypothetical protein n=1 Tax=Phaeobacter sp. J2-8 TaxID=2931394 RepID=UPI001FD3DE74|nr:hypothetical protein [Phaeobacter sp. J2-8]MCJ7874797.1 hypothetical protein [Phaeobacter sp. J2-8]